MKFDFQLLAKMLTEAYRVNDENDWRLPAAERQEPCGSTACVPAGYEEVRR